jgi:rRNA processing protein Gar1
MNRSKDLDTIAPDDPIVSNPITPKTEIKIENKTNIKSSSDLPKKSSKTKMSSEDEIVQKVYDILGHTKTPFSAFLVRPKVFSFSERDDNEEIYLASRPHWVNNLRWIITAIFMLFVPLFFHYFSFLNFFPVQYQLSAVLFWYLLTFIFAFEKFLAWYFNVFLITNERVVDIDFNNLLNKHFAEADLSAIQDVSSSVKGLLGTFFNYGDVLIQTAAEINEINFEKVPNPEKIIKLLKELRDLEEEKGGKHD